MIPIPCEGENGGPPPAGRMSIPWVVLVSLAVTLSAVGLPLQYAKGIDSKETALIAAERLQAEHEANLRWLDEVLTMSARLAAATGEDRWEARYKSFQPKLDAAIHAARGPAPRSEDDPGARLDAANAALVKMEHRSFELRRQGRSAQALTLLTGRGYALQKASYARELASLKSASRGERSGRHEAIRRAAFLAGRLQAAGLVLAVLTWVIAGLCVNRRFQDHEQGNRSLLEDQRRLADIVKNRTQDLASTHAALSQSDQAREAVERRQRAQVEVALLLGSADDEEDPLPRILESICRTLGWAEGAIWTVDETAGVLRNNGYLSLGFRDEEFEKVTREITFAKGVGLPGRVWEMQAPAWIVDVVKDPNFPRGPYAERAGLRAACAMPIIASNRFLGVLEFFRKAPEKPDLALLASLRTLGVHIGQYLERRRARNDHQRAQAMLAQSQKMDALGKLAGGVAHDFNNLLTIIKGACSSLEASVPAGDPRREDINDIKASSDRGAGLTRQLLAFTRQQNRRPVPLDVRLALTNAHGMLRRLIPESVGFEADLMFDLGVVLIDPGQFDLLLINLIVNAVDAMPQGGLVRLQARRIVIDEQACGKLTDLKPGPHLDLSIADTGTGISPETLAKIFDPFFTTKEVGKGTGLGLSTVDGIVRQNGGAIEVASVVGKGSRFTVYLPSASQPAPAVSAPAGAPPKGRETVLLVEDEPVLRRVARRILSEHGYAVIDAANAREALEFLDKGSRVDLLLTDIIMPGMNGRDLAREARSRRSSLKVLLMSGYSADILSPKDEEDAKLTLIEKPFSADSLLRGVHEALNGPFPIGG